MIKIKIKDIIPNPEWQTRNQLDEDNVLRLMDALKAGKELPAILVRAYALNQGVQPGEGATHKWEIFDGFHRYEAYFRLFHDNIEAEVFVGTCNEALAEGVKRNMQHGLQLLKKDMKKAARMLYVRGKPAGGERQPGSMASLAKLFGTTKGTMAGWVSPRSIETNRARSRKREKNRQDGAKIRKEGKEAALKRIEEETLERFGSEALGRKYEPNVTWSAEHKTGSPGTPILMLSDIHYGEVVNREEVYNSNEFSIDICEKRIKHTFETATGLLNHHFAYSNYPGIVLVLGGDMISGNLHEDHLATDEVPPLVQCYEIAKLVTDGIRLLSKEFPRVSVYGVAGNHGRTTRKPRGKFYAQHNLDWLAYKMIADYLEKTENVEVWAPNARDLNFVVAGHRYRLTHGDQFRGGDGIIGPIGPITRGDYKKRVTASLMPGQPEAYDTMLCGHFHTLMSLTRLIVNGSVKGYDEYAMSINCPWEPPQQALWTVHPKHGHTWSMPVICDPNYTAHPNLKGS